MPKVKKLREKVSSKLDIPKDIALNIPVIKMVGDSEILIENHKGILEYKLSILRIKSDLGEISLEGSNIEIKDISDEMIFVTGKIDSLFFTNL